MKTVTLNTEQQTLEAKALAVKQQLDQAQVGFGDEKTFTSMVSPEPFFISAQQHQLLIRRGAAIREWAQTTNRLYQYAVNNDAWSWLVDLFETGMPETLKTIHRQLFEHRIPRVPLFMRMDQPSFNVAVEAQTPGSGWGYHAALADCYRGYQVIGRRFVERVAYHLRALTGKQRPRVVHLLHKYRFYGAEAAYFAKAIRGQGIDFDICIQEIPENIASYDVVFRHYLEELIQYDGWQKLLELYQQGVLEIEPPPSVLTDHKVATMLPYHPRTFMLYSDAVRRLFPVTYVADPYSTLAVEQERGDVAHLRLSDIAVLNTKQRLFALKYAGLDPRLRAGGKGVLHLGMCSKSRAAQLINDAVSDTCLANPWVVQRIVRKQYDVTYYTHDGAIQTKGLYARINPFYALPREGGSELLGCPVHFRDFWKVHGQPDAVETICASS